MLLTICNYNGLAQWLLTALRHVLVAGARRCKIYNYECYVGCFAWSFSDGIKSISYGHHVTGTHIPLN